MNVEDAVCEYCGGPAPVDDCGPFVDEHEKVHCFGCKPHPGGER